MTAPFASAALGPSPSSASSGGITTVVDAMTDDERRYLQGFVDASACSVASQLWLYDAHGEYGTDHLPPALQTLDDADDWDHLARLYLVEQYHEMVARGDVVLQRDGDAYWVDPLDLVDSTSEIMSELIIAAVTVPGNVRPGGGISRATAESATADMPTTRVLAGDPPDPPALPVGAVDTWVPTRTRNDRGWTWQQPGSWENSNSIRVMDDDHWGRYEHGYVVFTNDENQPLTLDGTPGRRIETHIPRAADGSYETPRGWPDDHVSPP